MYGFYESRRKVSDHKKLFAEHGLLWDNLIRNSRYVAEACQRDSAIAIDDDGTSESLSGSKDDLDSMEDHLSNTGTETEDADEVSATNEGHHSRFRFLDLPRELRDMIYVLTFNGPPEIIYRTDTRFKPWTWCSHRLRAPNNATLLLCKQVYVECVDVIIPHAPHIFNIVLKPCFDDASDTLNCEDSDTESDDSSDGESNIDSDQGLEDIFLDGYMLPKYTLRLPADPQNCRIRECAVIINLAKILKYKYISHDTCETERYIVLPVEPIKKVLGFLARFPNLQRLDVVFYEPNNCQELKEIMEFNTPPMLAIYLKKALSQIDSLEIVSVNIGGSGTFAHVKMNGEWRFDCFRAWPSIIRAYFYSAPSW